MKSEELPARLKILKDFEDDIEQLSNKAKQIFQELINKKSNHELSAHQAMWHINGMQYHLKNIYKYYSNFVNEVSSRAASGAGFLIMHSLDYQSIFYELYALVNMTKISLDNLRCYLHPLFITPFDQLPKSFKDFIIGKTNCPIYFLLSNSPVPEYLLNLRNCIVHYRTFASSESIIVQMEGLNWSEIHSKEPFIFSIANASFRRLDEDSFSVNIYLPDKIFDQDAAGNKKLAEFTYKKKINLLSQAFGFCKMGIFSLTGAMQLLLDIENPNFIYSKKKAK